MFVDHNRHYAWDKLRQRDFRAFAPFLTDQVFERAAYYAGVGLGGGPLGRVASLENVTKKRTPKPRQFGGVPPPRDRLESTPSNSERLLPSRHLPPPPRRPLRPACS
jgi:hypothetical protein